MNLPASLQTYKDGQLRKEQEGRKKIIEGQNELVGESFPITTLWQVMLLKEEFPNVSFFFSSLEEREKKNHYQEKNKTKNFF